MNLVYLAPSHIVNFMWRLWFEGLRFISCGDFVAFGPHGGAFATFFPAKMTNARQMPGGEEGVGHPWN